jgi:hypothetical protein
MFLKILDCNVLILLAIEFIMRLTYFATEATFTFVVMTLFVYPCLLSLLAYTEFKPLKVADFLSYPMGKSIF